MPDNEDEKTQEIFVYMKEVRKRGYLSKKELIEILRWKSPRPLRHYELNDGKDIKEITRLSFATKNDCLKIHMLTTLTGVNYPSASAILMFYNPKKFPVLDIRVWKQLYHFKVVKDNSRGQNFTLQQCNQYLSLIRTLGQRLHLTARQVEKRLFDYDKQVQKQPIYKKWLADNTQKRSVK
jgi:hypothetical protein